MVTILYAGLLGLIYIFLTLYVVRGRWVHKIGLGDGGNNDMLRRIRMHGNFNEFVPLALLLVFLTDYSGYAPLTVHILGVMLVAGRLLHAYGLYRSALTSFGRFAGMVLTIMVLLVASALLIWKFVALQAISL